VTGSGRRRRGCANRGSSYGLSGSAVVMHLVSYYVIQFFCKHFLTDQYQEHVFHPSTFQTQSRHGLLPQPRQFCYYFRSLSSSQQRIWSQFRIYFQLLCLRFLLLVFDMHRLITLIPETKGSHIYSKPRSFDALANLFLWFHFNGKYSIFSLYH
jgi:hypothetical protein